MLLEVFWSHVLPFENLVVQFYLQMQSSLMDQLQEHEFTLLLANTPLDDVWTHFCSCACLAVGAWLLAYPSTPSFPFVFCPFSYNILYSFWYITSYIPYLSRCQCGHTIYDLGIHLLHCPCNNEHTTTHDMFRDTVVIIMSKSGTHV